MTPQDGQIILIGLYGFIFLEVFITIFLLRKNNVLVKIINTSLGTRVLKSFRCRPVTKTSFRLADGSIITKIPRAWGHKKYLIKTGKVQIVEEVVYYGMWDIFRRRPLYINYASQNQLVAESVPIVGVRTVIKVRKEGDMLNAYTPNLSVPEGSKTNINLMSWISEVRHELFEETKRQLTKAELFAQIAVPLGIIVLAMACLIFFPKIYAAIMQEGNKAVEVSSRSLGEVIKGMFPGGG